MGDGYTALGLREYRRGLVTIVVSFICSPEGLFCQSFSDYLLFLGCTSYGSPMSREYTIPVFANEICCFFLKVC